MCELWDLRKTGKGHSRGQRVLDWAPYDEAILGSGSADRRVNIWDVNKIGNEQTPEEAEDGPPELYFVHGGHKAAVSDFSWNEHADFAGVIASVDERNVLQIWQSVDLDEEEEGNGSAHDVADADLENDVGTKEEGEGSGTKAAMKKEKEKDEEEENNSPNGGEDGAPDTKARLFSQALKRGEKAG